MQIAQVIASLNCHARYFLLHYRSRKHQISQHWDIEFDIILTAPSVRTLQHLLDVCQQELDYLDMSINAKKSFCIRIGPCFNVDCCCVVTRDNHELAWCSSIRYLGIYITSSTIFRSSVSHNKQATYRAFNAIFGKVGRAVRLRSWFSYLILNVSRSYIMVLMFAHNY